MSTVSFVLLNYCSDDYVVKLIDSLGNQTNEDWDLVIVDNASPDDSLGKIVNTIEKYNMRNWNLIRLGQNLHFAQGMNVGISEAGGAIVVPLNSDVYLDLHYVEALCSAFEKYRQENVGCFVGNEYVWDWNGRCLTGEVRNCGVTLVHRITVSAWNPTSESITKLLGPSGSAAPFMREALEKIRLPNGDYYNRKFVSFGEDLDLLLRLRLNGYKSLYLPDLKFWHIGSASYGIRDLSFASKSNQLSSQILANRWRIWKNIPSSMEKMINLPIVLISDIYYLYSTFYRRGWKAMIGMLRKYIQAVIDIVQEKSYPYPISPGKINLYSGWIFSRTQWAQVLQKKSVSLKGKFLKWKRH